MRVSVEEGMLGMSWVYMICQSMCQTCSESVNGCPLEVGADLENACAFAMGA